jgi:ribosomal protein L40E
MILCRECGNSAPSSDGFCSSCGALLDWSGEQMETRVLPAVSVAAPEPAGWTPAAEARRADPVPIAPQPQYTGPYCQACGARNPEGRQFCRACGTELRLTSAALAARRRWWRRLFDRLRGRRDFAAGQRPSGFRDHTDGDGGAPRKRRRLPRQFKLGKLAPIAIVLGLAGIGLGPARTWITAEVSGLFGKAKTTVNQHYANVTPVGAKGAAEKNHGAGLAIDGLNTTYWASAQHTDGAGDTITVTFAAPVDLDQIGILSGADAADFRASARPHDLTVSAAGVPDTALAFDDSADFQSRALTLRHVTVITITVRDSYPGQKKHDLAIRDLEFFVKAS